MTEAGLRRVLIAGGAGFIGSYFVDRLLADPQTVSVTVYDNFTSGREWHLQPHAADHRLTVVRADIADRNALAAAMRGNDTVIHLASNPDIAKAMTEPTVDFYEGTVLTHNIVEAMRVAGVGMILYASGSGVYGDIGETEAHEDMGPLIPVSTYGASKLAGEALIASYCFMFGLRGRVFRFGNVVGPRQTHGVGFDFVRRLLADPRRLRILGDGTQSKSYVDVEDVVTRGVARRRRRVRTRSGPTTWPRATTSPSPRSPTSPSTSSAAPGATPSTSTPAAIAAGRATCPIVRLDTSRIRSLGWRNARTSRQALDESMRAMLPLARSGALG